MKKYFVVLFIGLIVFTTQTYSQIASVSLNATPDGICFGDSVIVEATPTSTAGDPDRKYEWITIPATPVIPVRVNGSMIKASPKIKTSFIVICYDLDYNRSFRDTITVSVTQIPTVFAGRDTAFCAGSIHQLIPEVDDKDSLRWTTNGKGLIDRPTATSPKYYPAPDEIGEVDFYLTVYGYEYCKVIKDTVTVLYSEKPLVSIKTRDTTICSFNELPLMAEASGYISVKWRIGEGFGSITNNTSLTPTFKPDPVQEGRTRIILDVKNNGCVQSDTLNVNIIPINIRVVPDTFCSGKKDYLYVEVIPYSTNYTFLWSTGEKTPQIPIFPYQNTSYWVEVKNKQECSNKVTKNIVVVDSPPNPGINANDKDRRITVTPEGMNTYTFLVNRNIVQEGKNRDFSWGEYQSIADTVFITITNNFGCSRDTIFKIPKIICVEAFSPNGDGINDRLLQGRKTIVFDRTEKILYQGWDGWDGTFNGREMPVGTYFYVLFDENNKVYCKSSVALLRSTENK